MNLVLKFFKPANKNTTSVSSDMDVGINLINMRGQGMC